MRIEYYSGGKKRRLTFEALPQPAPTPSFVKLAFAREVTAHAPMYVKSSDGKPEIILTSTMSVVNPTIAELGWLRTEYGFEVVREGSHGKVLLAAPVDAADPERMAAKVAMETTERGNVDSAQPNFLRITEDAPLSDTATEHQWALDNPGDPGVLGADVAAHAAWTITTGDPDVVVAVLDDGIEADHPALHEAIVAQHNFVDETDDASPTSTTDYHGTACAGIIASRDSVVKGLAHGVSLAACRVGTKVRPGWISEDFAVADGIDWCWEQAGASVLSMSFNNGGLPTPVVEVALKRALTEGRGGKGCVLVASSGNYGTSRVVYPARFDGVIAVGATNQWDERKTNETQDGETGWGSNSGTGLALMAPGVRVVTTDLTGADGDNVGPISGRFNGTSAAAPFVSAAAALILSVRNDLRGSDVRQILLASTDSLGPPTSQWDSKVGHGRLNVFTALRTARRWTA